MRIFFDLDGTLTDSSERHWRVYKKIVEELAGRPLQKNKYWSMIRSKSDKSEILKKSAINEKISPKNYLEKFTAKVETPEYLSYERLQDIGGFRRLSDHKGADKIFLLTLRKNSDLALEQIDALGIKKYFDKIIIANTSKIEAVAPHISRSEQNVFIGDTELDVETAKAVGGISVAVYSGFRDKKFLSRYRPDYLIPDLNQITKVIKVVEKE